MKRKFAMAACAAFAAITLAGCSDGGSATGSNSSAQQSGVNIEDLAWSVEEGIDNEDRCVLMSLTNNSNKTIVEFNLNFAHKADVTEEQVESFFSDIQSITKSSDETMSNVREMSDEQGGVLMYANNKVVLEPGESVSGTRCYYYVVSWPAKNIDHYNLMEPDIASIRYIDGEEVKTVLYDFKTKKYTVDQDTELAYQWPSTSLGDSFPKVEAPVVEIDAENEEGFSITAYGMSESDFNSYVDTCKEAGFTVDRNTSEGHYSADNSEGYNVRLSYYEQDDSMRGYFDASAK